MKRMLSLLLCLILCLSLFPAALAEQPEETEEAGIIELTPSEEEAPVDAALILSAPAEPAALPLPAETEVVVDSGTCGENLTWTLNEDGLLRISGTGYMEDYFSSYENYAPWWYEYRYKIRSLEICQGVRSIGAAAFMSCSNLKSVQLADSIREIHNLAFWGCKFTSIRFPKELQVLGEYTFRDVHSLNEAIFMGHAPEIGYNCFSGVVMTAYYPAGDDTWDAFDPGDCGGAVTWQKADWPVITSQPKNLVVGESGLAEFRVKADGVRLTYQWQWRSGSNGNWVDSGQTGNKTETLSVPATMARNGQQYRCIVSTPCFSLCSDAATLTVSEKPVISVPPRDVTVGVGDKALFTVAAQGKGLSYQWQWSADGGKTWKDSSASTSGYNTEELQVSATLARSGYRYRCKVTNSFGTALSAAATLTVNHMPVITAHPQNVTASVSGTAEFTARATGEDLRYQWQWSADGGKTWEDSGASTEGYNTATLLVKTTQAMDDYQYRCKVSNSDGTTVSDAATLKVIVEPLITVQPVSQTLGVGGTATFSIAAQGVSLSYQWQWREKDGKTWKDSSASTSGYNTATLQVSVTLARNGYQYRCKVRNTFGSKTSDTVTLTVNHMPVITAQPQSVTAGIGAAAIFTVSASGPDLSYQWQWRRGASGTWANSSLQGCTTATLSVPATLARNGQQYRCLVSNSDGGSYSAAATLTVSDKPVIAIQPKSVTAGVGGTARFTVTAQGEGLSYQWQWRRGASGTWANSSLQGCTEATLRVPATLTRNGQQYRCLVTNANGSALSAAATLTVSELPVITAQPESVSVPAGSTAKFTVTASGSDLSYQWQWSSDGGKTWKNSSSSTAGYNTPILSIAATAARSGYRYRCTVTNINGSVHTGAVTLTVN